MTRVTARIPHPNEDGEPVQPGDARLVEPDRARQLVALRWVEPLSATVAAKVPAPSPTHDV